MTHNGLIIVSMASIRSQHREKLNKVRVNKKEEKKLFEIRQLFVVKFSLNSQLCNIVNSQDVKSTVH